jgi:lysophospholipase L1-like esterase
MQWLPGVLRVDMVIFLTGANDLAASLAFQGDPTEAQLEKQAQYQGDLPAGMHWRSKYPRYRRLVLPSLIQQTYHDVVQRIHPPSVLQRIDTAALRKRRAAGPVVPLPDLTTGLKEYRSRILTLASQCRDLKVRCLFLTQTSMWRSGLSPAEQRLLWLGYTGPFDNPTGYVSAGDMGHAMDLYNGTLLDVCAQSGLECFDVASTIPKDTSAYFDDAHFNENGARLMARNVERYLLSKPPFGMPDRHSILKSVKGRDGS